MCWDLQKYCKNSHWWVHDLTQVAFRVVLVSIWHDQCVKIKLIEVLFAVCTHTSPPQELCCHVRKKAAAEASARNRKWVCVTHPGRGSADCERQRLCVNVLAAVQPLPSSFPKNSRAEGLVNGPAVSQSVIHPVKSLFVERSEGGSLIVLKGLLILTHFYLLFLWHNWLCLDAAECRFKSGRI